MSARLWRLNLKAGYCGAPLALKFSCRLWLRTFDGVRIILAGDVRSTSEACDNQLAA
jgi:hypothetical protein